RLDRTRDHFSGWWRRVGVGVGRQRIRGIAVSVRRHDVDVARTVLVASRSIVRRMLNAIILLVRKRHRTGLLQPVVLLLPCGRALAFPPRRLLLLLLPPRHSILLLHLRQPDRAEAGGVGVGWPLIVCGIGLVGSTIIRTSGIGSAIVGSPSTGSSPFLLLRVSGNRQQQERSQQAEISHLLTRVVRVASLNDKAILTHPELRRWITFLASTDRSRSLPQLDGRRLSPTR